MIYGKKSTREKMKFGLKIGFKIKNLIVSAYRTKQGIIYLLYI